MLLLLLKHLHRTYILHNVSRVQSILDGLLLESNCVLIYAAPEGKSRIEVSFALDCSSSGKEEKSGEDKILTQIKFVKDMIKCWNISMNHVKDSHLVVYGDTAGKLPLDQSNKSLSDHLQELKIGKWSESRCRRMDLALKEAAKCFRSDPNEIYHLIVLITSGKQGSDNESRREGGQPEKFLESAATTTAGKKGSDNDNEEGGKGLLESVAEELFSEKIKVIVVPVGLENDFQELGLIVKRPQYLFPLSSFKDMDYDTAKKIALNIEATVGELFLFSLSCVKVNVDWKFLF